MRIRLACAFLIMFFSVSVLGHSHALDLFLKKSVPFSSVHLENSDESAKAQNSGCSESGVHFCGCVHSVVVKNLDLKVSSPAYVLETYISFYAQLSEQEFIKKLKRPPKV